MKTSLLRFCLHSAVWLLGLVLVTPGLARDKTVRVDFGTIAPTGSSFHRALQGMADQWRSLSGGSVRVVVHAGGVLGGDSEMVQLMRGKSLQAAMLTAKGLLDIEPSVSALQSMPMRFRTLEEFDHVNDLLRPGMEQAFAAKGFVILTWADAGWVRYFAKEPVLYPDDLKSRKVFAWEGDPAQIKLMRDLGLNPIPLDSGAIQSSLATGLIDVVAMPPVFANAGRIDQQAPYMLALNWAPLVGAMVIHQETWNRIPAAMRDPLRAAAEAAGAEIRAKSRQESEDSVAAMEKRGLKVVAVTPAIQRAWEAKTEADLLPRVRGAIVPADLFDEVNRIVAAYRAASTAEGQ